MDDLRAYETLMMCGTDLTQMALEGKLDPVIGREKEIELVSQILCKRNRNSACLIGDQGVGKTAIVRGLALSMIKPTVPPDQRNRIFSLDIESMIARGHVMQNLTKIVDEVKNSNGRVILFLDELHTFIAAVPYILKCPITRGELKCIGATTPEECKKFFEKDPALKRLFQIVQVPEPSVDETTQILRGLKRKFEDSHQVTYTDGSLIASSKLSKRYISDDVLPYKAIDVVDEAGARMKLRGGSVVTSAVIEDIISSQTGVPAEKLSGQGSARLLQLEKIFQEQIIGQDEAVEAIARAIRRASVGFGDPDRPVASLLFIGPTGVGKTEVAKLLALEYFGSKDSMIRLDMSEYKEKHSISRLFGSPPGYIGCNDGGQLTEAIRKKPHCLILLDEVEKAHPDIFDAFLQVLDDGRLTDGKGKVVHFKDAIIVMTSNIGFSHGLEEARLEDVNEHLKNSFRPEFLNRIDETVVFKRLGEREMMKIMEVMLKQFCQRIEANGISLEILDGFKKRLISDIGGSGKNEFGARPLKRAITRKMVDKLAENCIRGDIKKGDSIIVNADSMGNACFLHKDDEAEGWNVVSPINSNCTSDQSASRVVSEEPVSAAYHEYHSGLNQSVSLKDHQILFHELNTLEWDELVVQDDPTKPIAPPQRM